MSRGTCRQVEKFLSDVLCVCAITPGGRSRRLGVPLLLNCSGLGSLVRRHTRRQKKKNNSSPYNFVFDGGGGANNNSRILTCVPRRRPTSSFVRCVSLFYFLFPITRPLYTHTHTQNGESVLVCVCVCWGNPAVELNRPPSRTPSAPANPTEMERRRLRRLLAAIF